MLQLGLLLLAAAQSAPAPEFKVVEEILVKINGEIITRSEWEKNLAEARAELVRQKTAGAELDKVLAERQKDLLRDLIDTSLLTQKGKEMNVNVEAQLLRYLDEMRRQNNVASMEEFEKWAAERSGMPWEDLKEQIRNQMLTQRVVQQEVGSRVNVAKEELAKYYEEHKAEFVRPEQVRLREILISTEGKDPKEIPALEKKAADTLARLRKGERFPDVASKVSDNPDSAKAGGDIGFFKRGVLDKQIEELVFTARRGTTTDVIKRPNGFLILRVEERHQEGQAPLEEVEQDIHERLFMPKMQPALRTYLTRLREDAFIEIRPGYVDSGAAPGKDTAWKDPEQFRPAVTTKAEAAKKKRRLLWVMPLPGGGKKKDKDKDKPQAEAKPAAPAPEKPQ